MLILVTGVLLLVEYLFSEDLNLHSVYKLLVLFLSVQAFVIFRMHHWAPKEWAARMSLVKTVIRLLSSLIFIMILMNSQSDQFNLAVQFIILYLVYMIFEIAEALTNLRRN